MDGGQILTVQTGGRIGPNAILQTIAILDHCEGRPARDLVMETGDYILRHRIPAPARAVIRALPGFLGARLLVAAISRHAWTFAGTGSFRVTGWRPLTFEIVNNPLIRGEYAAAPMCHWHAAVFERLFSRLVWRSAVVAEVSCAATGAGACRFTVTPRAR
jgi:divinyl protochlorophyllide a 8-vinyl-reductase